VKNRPKGDVSWLVFGWITLPKVILYKS